VTQNLFKFCYSNLEHICIVISFFFHKNCEVLYCMVCCNNDKEANSFQILSTATSPCLTYLALSHGTANKDRLIAGLCW